MKESKPMIKIQAQLFWVCSDCGQALPPEAFRRDASKPSGHRGRCKECQRIINRERERNRPRRARATEQAAWKRENPEKVQLYHERARAKRAADPEAERARQREWRRNNPEKVKEYQARARAKRKG